MRDEEYREKFQKELAAYIKLEFNQDQCNGFMHGFHKGAGLQKPSLPYLSKTDTKDKSLKSVILKTLLLFSLVLVAFTLTGMFISGITNIFSWHEVGRLMLIIVSVGITTLITYVNE